MEQEHCLVFGTRSMYFAPVMVLFRAIRNNGFGIIASLVVALVCCLENEVSWNSRRDVIAGKVEYC